MPPLEELKKLKYKKEKERLQLVSASNSHRSMSFYFLWVFFLRSHNSQVDQDQIHPYKARIASLK